MIELLRLLQRSNEADAVTVAGLSSSTMPAGGYTDRSEMYHPDDTMKSATLDLKNRHRVGSVPFAQNEDVDPQYYPRDGEVSAVLGHPLVLLFVLSLYVL